MNDTLLQLSNEACQVVRALKDLGVPSLPILNEDYARYLHRYPPLLRHVSQLIAGIRGQMKKTIRKAGEAAIRQTLTQVISALKRHHPQLSLQAELSNIDPAAPPPPGVSEQVNLILESFSRED